VIEKPIDWEKVGGLLPAVIQNFESGQVLMLGYLSPESWNLTLATGEVHFFSRTRNRIWKKGETSGHVLKMKEWFLDCDADSFLLLVEPAGATCHEGNNSCFGTKIPTFSGLRFLEEKIAERWESGNKSDSYVAKLRDQGLPQISQKLGEEAIETVIAALAPENPQDFVEESSDLFFHWLVLAKSLGQSFDLVIQNLKRRNRLS